LSPTSLACSSVIEPKPANEPINDAGLRPAPSISVFKASGGLTSPADRRWRRSYQVRPRDTEPKPRRETGGSVRNREAAVEAALAEFPCNVLEQTSEPFNRDPSGQMPATSHGANTARLRVESDAAVEGGRVPGNRFGGPAGPTRAALCRHADRCRNDRRRIERFRSIDPSNRGTSSKRTEPRPCTLLPPIVPANRSKSSVAG
jgi:hypothetical protein